MARSRRYASTAAALFALGVTPLTALAQSPAPPQYSPPASSAELEGRSAFERGIQALQVRRFADAVLALREAMRLRPSPLTIYNLALALRGTGSYVETVMLFDRYLAAPEEGAATERLAAIRAEVTSLRGAIPRVELNVQPTTAALRIDGRPSTLEATGLRLDPGRHVVEVEAAGFVSDRREISLSPGAQLVLAIALRPEVVESRLLVEPSIPSAQVSVDGISWGRGRVDRTVTQGLHVVEVRAAGHEPWRREIRVQSVGATRLDVALAPTRASRGWVLPVAITGGLLAVGAIVVGIAVASRGDEPAVQGNWGSFTLP